MVLPGAQLFPHVPFSLYIFEPRYRAMLSWSLEHDRMFCLAPLKPGVSEARKPDDFYHTVGLGLVRACVGRKDGTSHLILQGLTRVRIQGFLQDAPFRIAELRELVAPIPSGAERERLTAELHDLCARHFTEAANLPMPLEQQLEQIDDPAILSNVIAHACLQDTEVRQAVFEELDVTRRVALLTEYLGR